MISTVIRCGNCNRTFARVDSHGKGAVALLKKMVLDLDGGVNIFDGDRYPSCQVKAEICNRYLSEGGGDQNSNSLSVDW